MVKIIPIINHFYTNLLTTKVQSLNYVVSKFAIFDSSPLSLWTAPNMESPNFLWNVRHFKCNLRMDIESKVDATV